MEEHQQQAVTQHRAISNVKFTMYNVQLNSVVFSEMDWKNTCTESHRESATAERRYTEKTLCAW